MTKTVAIHRELVKINNNIVVYQSRIEFIRNKVTEKKNKKRIEQYYGELLNLLLSNQF